MMGSMAMKDEKKTKKQLIEELSVLKRIIQELEQSESERKRMGESLQRSEKRYREFGFHLRSVMR